MNALENVMVGGMCEAAPDLRRDAEPSLDEEEDREVRGAALEIWTFSASPFADIEGQPFVRAAAYC